MPAERAWVVCLDPGHPSEVGRGTTGHGGLTELHANWLVALALRELLEADGISVVMTRESEAGTVTNRRRAEIANEAHADLLLRLHCDDRKTPGTALYVPDREGRAQGHSGPSAEVRLRSRELAERLLPAMRAELPEDWPSLGVLGDDQTRVGAGQGALTGSIFSEVPCITVEMLSLTNREDERFLASDSGPETMARALRAGVLAALTDRR